MRIHFALFLCLVYLNSDGQDLKKTFWVKIKAERKDGSKIINRFNFDNESIKYSFGDKTVLTFVDEQYETEENYSVNKNVLTIGNFQDYKIDTITNLVLALTEIPKYKSSDDEINSFIFVNGEALFEYLYQTKQLNFVGDSMILCGNLFSPAYKGNFGKLISKEFHPVTLRGIITGTVILSADGNIKSVQAFSNDKFRKKEIEKFVSIINSTTGLWLMPATLKKFEYKINYACQIEYFRPFSSINFAFHTQDPKIFDQIGLPFKQAAEAEYHFNKGTELFNNEKFKNAIDEFSKCIQIDSLYLNAYYNKAYSFQSLGNKEAACEIWKKLKEIGQKQGEKLYSDNCK